MADYIYQFNGQESGPLSFVELATQLAASELTADTLVRSQDSNDWMAAEDVPGLVRAAKKIAATFPETNSNVATSQPVVLTGINVSMDNVDSAQWLSNTTIKFAVGDPTYTRRSQHVAERSDTDGTFNVTSQIPLQNPWPRMSFSSEFARAYFANASGLSITAPKLQIEKFGLGLILLDSEAIGPIDDAMDDPVFVVPQEDIVFYTGRGTARGQSQAPRLWMIRF